MTRIKWLNFTNNTESKNFRSFSKLLKNLNYSDEVSSGFLIDELRGDYLASRFISKNVIKQQVETPFGELLDQEFVSYLTTRFLLSDIGPGIELIDPPRSISTFLNQLSFATNFQISISELKVDLKKWIKGISQHSEFPLVLKSFECRDIKLNDNLIGSLSVSGSGEIEREIKVILGNKKYSLKRVKLAIGGCSIVLSDNCSAQISGGDKEHISNILRSAIPLT